MRDTFKTFGKKLTIYKGTTNDIVTEASIIYNLHHTYKTINVGIINDKYLVVYYTGTKFICII